MIKEFTKLGLSASDLGWVSGQEMNDVALTARDEPIDGGNKLIDVDQVEPDRVQQARRRASITACTSSTAARQCRDYEADLRRLGSKHVLTRR